MEANSAATSPADSAPRDQPGLPNPFLSLPPFFSQQIPPSFQLPSGSQSNQPSEPQQRQTDPQQQQTDLLLQQFQSQAHKINELLQVVMMLLQRQQQVTLVVNTLMQRNYLLPEAPILQGRSLADVYTWLEELENHPQSREPSRSRSDHE